MRSRRADWVRSSGASEPVPRPVVEAWCPARGKSTVAPDGRESIIVRSTNGRRAAGCLPHGERQAQRLRIGALVDALEVIHLEGTPDLVARRVLENVERDQRVAARA